MPGYCWCGVPKSFKPLGQTRYQKLTEISVAEIVKRLDTERVEFVQHAAEKRFARSIRKTKKGKKGRQNRKEANAPMRPSLAAPSKLDLYSPKNHTRFIDFLEKLRAHVSSNEFTTITFRDTNRITASAGLMLVAETDRLMKAYPNSKISCFLPPRVSEGVYRNANNTVESALNQIGFFKLIGQANNRCAKIKSVSMWKQLSGDTADGSLASSLLESLSSHVPQVSRRKIYRGAIEAIANCVEHAYPTPRKDGLNIQDSRWWMLVGIDDNDLNVLVCDLGVGISETLPEKHPQTLLDHIKNTFNIFGTSDSEMIRMSTLIKQTRTQLYNRGKGGKDFRSITKNFPAATLTIRSNKGVFYIRGATSKPLRNISARRFVEGTNRTESMLEHSKSIHGTILEWIVPLKEVKE